MNSFRKNKYESLEEWNKDLDKLRKNPKDNSLAVLIATKVDNSKEEVRLEIKNYLISKAMLSDNPVEVFKIIKKDYPNKVLCIKSKDSPWFEV